MGRWANWRREPARGAKIRKNWQNGKAGSFSDLRCKIGRGDAGNGKTSRAIGRRANWRYKPARALKSTKMVNKRAHGPMG